jgi:hypothetical protein
LPPWLSTGSWLEAVTLVVSLIGLATYALFPMVAPMVDGRL